MLERKDSVHNVCHFPALACKRYRTFGPVFLTSEDLENMSVNGPINLVAWYFKIVRKHNGSIRICVSLGTIIETFALFLLVLLLLLLPPPPPLLLLLIQLLVLPLLLLILVLLLIIIIILSISIR